MGKFGEGPGGHESQAAAEAAEQERLDQQLREGEEMAAAYLAQHPVPEVLEKRECAVEIEKFNRLVAEFEAAFSIEHLLSIQTEEEARRDEVREAAKPALKPILDQLKALQRETDISSQELSAAQAAWKRISNAVGMINSGRVDHDR